MQNYHAVLLDECGMEFGAGTRAASRDEAYDHFAENYPESRVIQLESAAETQEREARIYADALYGADYY